MRLRIITAAKGMCRKIIGICLLFGGGCVFMAKVV